MVMEVLIYSVKQRRRIAVEIDVHYNYEETSATEETKQTGTRQARMTRPKMTRSVPKRSQNELARE